MVDWVGQAKGLAMPAAYIVVLMALMATFSSLYRKRQAATAASLTPWFPTHLPRNVYLSLLHMEQIEPGKEKPVAVPDSIIKAALLRRAVEDIHRIVALRSSKTALQTLLQRGSVGDDLWQRFQRAEQELQAELEDVVAEANALAPGWGQSIFQSANEMAANARLRERIAEVQGQSAEERAWWNKRRDQSARELMEESSDSSEESDSESSSGDDDAGAGAAKGESGSAGSEESGVLVSAEEEKEKEAPAPRNQAPTQTQSTSVAGGASSGGKKKKKGKGKK